MEEDKKENNWARKENFKQLDMQEKNLRKPKLEVQNFCWESWQLIEIMPNTDFQSRFLGNMHKRQLPIGSQN